MDHLIIKLHSGNKVELQFNKFSLIIVFLPGNAFYERWGR